MNPSIVFVFAFVALATAVQVPYTYNLDVQRRPFFERDVQDYPVQAAIRQYLPYVLGNNFRYDYENSFYPYTPEVNAQYGYRYPYYYQRTYGERYPYYLSRYFGLNRYSQDRDYEYQYERNVPSYYGRYQIPRSLAFQYRRTYEIPERYNFGYEYTREYPVVY